MQTGRKKGAGLESLGASAASVDKQINTVRAAWLEYTRCIDLLLENKNDWRRSDSETRFYNRRKPLYTAINKLVNGNYSACLKF